MSSKLGRKGKIIWCKGKNSNLLALFLFFSHSRPTFSTFDFHQPNLVDATSSGDPRMHKAVAARLADPSLSLYEALCIGGFDYSENDDKSVLDSKQVTLGQRKNQLSRRLRLARKQGAGDNNVAAVPQTSSNGALFDDMTAHHNGTNGITNSDKEQGAQKNLNGKQNIPLSTLGHHRSKNDLIYELGTSSFNNDSNGRNREAMEAQQQKRQRFTRCLNSTTFERTCTTTPANLYLHQGWQLGNFPQMGGAGNIPPGSMNGSTQGVNYSSSQFYTPQMANRIPDQNIPRYQHGASGMALSSLAATAQSVGLTLDQLALSLSSNTNSLSKLVAEVRSGDSELKQEQMALDLYRTDVKGLYTKCMLVAGFDASLVEQNTTTYIKFATKAWEEEGKRLRSLQDAINRGKETKTVRIASPPQLIQGPANARKTYTTDEKNTSTVVSSDSNKFNQHQTRDNRSDGHHTDGQHAPKHEGSKCEARHMHRPGECGHRTVIHQPKDGAPHVDFIVNDQVECYAGQDSVSLAGKSIDTAWPSKYKCKDVDENCSKHCGKSVASETESNWGNMDTLSVTEPKVFKLSEIDGDPEWSFDVNEDSDGGVMGLFKLGRETSTELASNN
jgi:hypothetical protein